jgi:hypothetical protein
MTLRDFLNASYALLVEGYLTLAPNRIDLLTAVEKVEDAWSSLTTSERPETKPENVKAQNAAAMAQLQGMLAGVKGSPV